MSMASDPITRSAGTSRLLLQLMVYRLDPLGRCVPARPPLARVGADLELHLPDGAPRAYAVVESGLESRRWDRFADACRSAGCEPWLVWERHAASGWAGLEPWLEIAQTHGAGVALWFDQGLVPLCGPRIPTRSVHAARR